MSTAAPSRPRLPWFIRVGDRIVGRHERWATEMRGGPDYYPTLVRFATTGDPAARAWLAEALSRYDFIDGSRVRGFYLILLLVFAPFVAFDSLRGCGLVLLLALAAPLLGRFDRWNRRRKAWNALGEAKAEIYRKVEVKRPAAGSRVFQSYWCRDGHPPVELDHPMELWNAVNEATEWWQWQMPVPSLENGRVVTRLAHDDVGLVHRDAAGHCRLLAGGVVYFSYDPWTDRVDKGSYA